MAGGNVLKGLSETYEDLASRALDDAIDTFTRIAKRHGGRVGKYPLTAKPTNRRVSRDVASVTMEGVPSGFWVWKESGIGGHWIRRKRARMLAGALDHPLPGPVWHHGVLGKRAWTMTVEEADRAIHDLVITRVED